METLAAVAIISIAGFSVLFGFSSALRAVQSAKDNGAFALKLLFADEVLRSRIGAVNIPYWEQVSVETGDEITVPWFKGNRESTVSVSVIDGALVLETVHGEEQERFVLAEGLEDISVAPVPDAGPVLGFDIQFSHKGRDYRIAAGFASRPLKSIGGRI
jgi:hypothetical protein